MNKTALFPGSFDPVTLGHQDLIQRAADLFDTLYVMVGVNDKKFPLFSDELKVELIETLVSDYKNVQVVLHRGLTVNFMKENKINYIVRGVRNHNDFEAEYQLQWMNKNLFSKCETILLPTKLEYKYISSSLVRQIIGLGEDFKPFVPEKIYHRIKEIVAH